MELGFGERDFTACCGSKKFAEEMSIAGPFTSLEQALEASRDIWFNKVDINGWLEAFATHPQIGETPSVNEKNETSAKWSKGEQSIALATASNCSLQELSEWNSWYKQKFGFVFLICASGKSSAEILGELKKRFSNRLTVELEIAAQEQMKITELRLVKLFDARDSRTPHAINQPPTGSMLKQDFRVVADERIGRIGAHLSLSTDKTLAVPSRTRPPITTHVLDVSVGRPGVGIEVSLEKWEGSGSLGFSNAQNVDGWSLLGASVTDSDGRSGRLLPVVDRVPNGYYRISFNTGKYLKAGFFPYVSIVFEIKETQVLEHFHVPLLLSPYSFSTYRGS
ncbi:hypothetical protein AMTRI_Chr13g82740 [Amborella trichopoda]